MSIAATASCRFRQLLIRRERGRRMPQQTIEEGAGAVFTAAQLVRDHKLQKPLVVIGEGAERMGERVLHALSENDIPYVRGAGGAATVDDAEALAQQWLREGCGCFIALGDGAVIDLVKLAAARAVCRGKTVMDMVGVDRVPRRKTAPLIAVPTVAGDSAASRASATLRDGMGGTFHAESQALVPAYAVLDPELVEAAPRPAVAAAALDGLCLAAEAYLSGYADETAKKAAAEAVRGYFASAEACWNDGGTVSQRGALLAASYRAGASASVAGCGYARAICRALERVYDVPAGEAAAVVLPLVLEKYGNRASDGLAGLAAAAGLPSEGSPKATAAAFIERLRNTAFRMGLAETLEAIRPEDIAELADTAAADANPRWFSPVVWTAAECADVLRAASAQRKI